MWILLLETPFSEAEGSRPAPATKAYIPFTTMARAPLRATLSLTAEV